MQDRFVTGAHAVSPRSCRNRRFTESPIDALVDLVVWRGLHGPIPVGYPIWLAVDVKLVVAYEGKFRRLF